MTTRPIEPPFILPSEGAAIRVTEHEVKGSRIFYIVFPGTRKPLTITVSERRGTDEKFWTSIPEGRQPEAEHYGKLIANFIRSKRRT
ncbi:hypothetical protein FO440_23360 [Mucilaginibacter corticis]|uniref:Uncharacterized protein n=1 Tax=Mucilaginibacter corticis TaxID=2597670 RepID=A0A556M964_9SPHI|nr:hypothetical protein [Mucilaginibacter corticis]TSJ36442.1 hypothetical protein FO440_23360 [Mucilaginibacter corticis]